MNIKPKTKKRCLQCGSQFLVPPSESERKYCCRGCYLDNHRKNEIRQCPVCGKNFKVGKNSKVKQKYCSKKCFTFKKIFQCVVCNKTFEVHKYRSYAKYCSRRCFESRSKLKECLICGKLFKIYPSNIGAKYCSSQCYGESLATNMCSGHSHNNRKHYRYKNISFRSSWEVKYAQYLDQNNIKWIYEPKYFRLSSNNSYVPDFYLVEQDKYIEIKGYWYQKSKEKFELFKKEYPNLTIDLLMQKQLIQLGII